MFEVRVEADFAAAHFLKDYNGKCENLHGHNYHVQAYVRGKKLNEGGMLMDFAKLKNALRTVCGFYDHKNLNDFDVFKNNPSAERIAMLIYEKIIEEVRVQGTNLSFNDKSEEPFLYAVDVFETPTSRATYCPFM